MGSTTTNDHCVAAFDLAIVSACHGCDQLVVDPTHARIGTFGLQMTDVPDLVQFAVQDLPWRKIFSAKNPV